MKLIKLFLAITFLLFLTNCSFDNKTGIWKNIEKAEDKAEDRFKDFKTLNIKTQSFNQIIKPSSNLNIKINPVKLNLNWPDEHYQETNNLENFSYKNLNKIIFKSKKLSKYTLNDSFVFDGGKAITSDYRGNVIVYSLDRQAITLKYNFYKKRFKGINKKLTLIAEKNIIYVSDNLGYLYAINHVENKLLWAKNYKVPFKSNLKFLSNQIVLSDINNSLYFVDKLSGEKIKIIPTEETLIKNDFINSLAVYKDSLFYLNTFGSLYSIDKNLSIKWFLNLNQSADITVSDLFSSKPLIVYKDKIIVSTNPYLYVLNSKNGSTIFKSSVNSIIKPIISGKNIFLITRDNLLVCIDIIDGNLVYSIDISKEIGEFIKSKNKSITIKTLAIVNNDLYVFLKNSYLVKFSINGVVQDVSKLSAKLSTFPIFINDSIIYISNKSKLIILN